MELLDMIFGVIGVISFIFGIYQYYITEKAAATENSKTVLQAEKLKDIYEGLRGVGGNVDMMVQLPKHKDVRIQEMQDLARAVRNEVYVLMNTVKGEKKRLDEWQYGKMIVSGPIDENLNLAQPAIIPVKKPIQRDQEDG